MEVFMKLQILLKKEDVKIADELLDNFSDIIIKKAPLKNTDSTIVTFETSSNNMNDAKTIDNVHGLIKEKISFKILVDDRVAHFNKNLFPLINDFERLLRKFLYVGAEVDDKHEIIKELENKSLEEIFIILFVDIEYSTNFFETIKKNNNFKKMNKTAFLALLNEKKEESLWNEMFSSLDVRFIEENYLTLKNYRNSVMHAHNIDYQNYSSAKELYYEVNEILRNNIDIYTGEGDYPNINYSLLLKALTEKVDITGIFPKRYEQTSLNGLAEVLKNMFSVIMEMKNNEQKESEE